MVQGTRNSGACSLCHRPQGNFPRGMRGIPMKVFVFRDFPWVESKKPAQGRVEAIDRKCQGIDTKMSIRGQRTENRNQPHQPGNYRVKSKELQ